ncbi:hypothetical protein Ciccas_004237, partial [Cichlidogyrus casuarinus]
MDQETIDESIEKILFLSKRKSNSNKARSLKERLESWKKWYEKGDRKAYDATVKLVKVLKSFCLSEASVEEKSGTINELIAIMMKKLGGMVEIYSEFKKIRDNVQTTAWAAEVSDKDVAHARMSACISSYACYLKPTQNIQIMRSQICAQVCCFTFLNCFISHNVWECRLRSGFPILLRTDYEKVANIVKNKSIDEIKMDIDCIVNDMVAVEVPKDYRPELKMSDFARAMLAYMIKTPVPYEATAEKTFFEILSKLGKMLANKLGELATFKKDAEESIANIKCFAKKGEEINASNALKDFVTKLRLEFRNTEIKTEDEKLYFAIAQLLCLEALLTFTSPKHTATHPARGN